MPANSFGGTRAIVVRVHALAFYAYSRRDTYADVVAVPGGGTTLELPDDPNDGDFYVWNNTDGSCGALSPLTIALSAAAVSAGSKLQGGASSASYSAANVAGFAVWFDEERTWSLFVTGASGGPITPNAAQKAPAWFIAPITGSDANAGTTALAPLKTWRELVTRWGTLSPMLAQTTLVTFLESQPDGTDPVIAYPYHVAGGSLSIVGVLGAAQTIASGVLGAVTPKNRATPQLLEADLGTGLGAAGLLLHNVALDAYCWLFQNVAGTTWSLSQPLAATVLPPPPDAFPAEVDTFVPGNAFVLYAPVRVNVVDLRPVLVDYSAGFNNFLYLNRLTVFDPSGIGDDDFYLGLHVALYEVRCDRAPVYVEMTQLDEYQINANCYFDGGADGGPAGGGFLAYVGGVLTGATQFGFTDGVVFDGDLIYDAQFGAAVSLEMGLVYIAAGRTLTVSGGRSSLIDIAGGYGPTVDGQALWGPGAFALFYNACLFYKPNYTAAAILLLTGGLQMNLSATAWSIDAGSAIHQGIPITAANLDAAAGPAGFGGRAFLLGGASIVGSEA